ncbi:hypothetical protein SPFM8_00169 [Salmonella phage SPFM8]|nr:hypothetical protein SPFM8_00169 [Salmonella phage SPFM8]
MTVEHVKEVPEIVSKKDEVVQFVSRADMAKLLVGYTRKFDVENFMHSGLLDTSLHLSEEQHAFVAAPNERYDFKAEEDQLNAEELVKSLRPEQEEGKYFGFVTESAVATLDDYTLADFCEHQPRPWHLWVMHLTELDSGEVTASPRIRAIATDMLVGGLFVTFIGSSIRRLGPYAGRGFHYPKAATERTAHTIAENALNRSL